MAGQRSSHPLDWRAGTVLLALLPLLSLGFLGFVPATWLAAHRRTSGAWAVVVFFVGALAAEGVADLSTAKGHSPNALFWLLVLVVTLGACAHFVASLQLQVRKRLQAWAAQPWPTAVPDARGAWPPAFQQPGPWPGPYPPPSAPAPAFAPAPVPAPAPAPAPVPVRDPATEDVGAELRRLSERLREPGGPREPGAGGGRR